MSLTRGHSEGAKNLVGFTLAGGHYAIAIDEVREVVNPTALTSLPKAPSMVAGIVDHRGEVILVVDLRTHFDLHEPPRPLREKWVLLRRSGVGLVVDQVTGVLDSPEDGLRPAPPVRGEAQRGILGVINKDALLTFVVDVRLFEEVSESLRLTSNPSTKTIR